MYKSCQRIFHKTDNLVLTRDDKVRHLIRRKALRRFLHGCPPRKKTDTSFGDAFNWEWMVHCATENNAELVIVSRDSDYGIVFENVAHVNDHLKQEFSERVSKKRKLLLYTRLSDALKHFAVPVSPAEVATEAQLIASSATAEGDAATASRAFEERFKAMSLSEQRDVVELLRKLYIDDVANTRTVLDPSVMRRINNLIRDLGAQAQGN